MTSIKLTISHLSVGGLNSRSYQISCQMANLSASSSAPSFLPDQALPPEFSIPYQTREIRPPSNLRVSPASAGSEFSPSNLYPDHHREPRASICAAPSSVYSQASTNNHHRRRPKTSIPSLQISGKGANRRASSSFSKPGSRRPTQSRPVQDPVWDSRERSVCYEVEEDSDDDDDRTNVQYGAEKGGFRRYGSGYERNWSVGPEDSISQVSSSSSLSSSRARSPPRGRTRTRARAESVCKPLSTASSSFSAFTRYSRARGGVGEGEVFWTRVVVPGAD